GPYRGAYDACLSRAAFALPASRRGDGGRARAALAPRQDDGAEEAPSRCGFRHGLRSAELEAHGVLLQMDAEGPPLVRHGEGMQPPAPREGTEEDPHARPPRGATRRCGAHDTAHAKARRLMARGRR